VLDSTEFAMCRLFTGLAFVFAAVFAVAACSPAPQGTPGALTIVEPWAMATPPGAAVGVGYMTIRNQTGAAVRLTGGESPVAQRVEVHSMSMDGGVMTMRPVEGGLEIPAGGAVELKPDGMHLMLIGLQRPLIEGESVTLTLVFDNGMRIDAPLSVRAMGGGHDH
jgi:copper(I)-binding protein